MQCLTQKPAICCRLRGWKFRQESGQVTQELAQAQAQARASWERSTRMGKALSATYTVQGWRQSNGQLWKHNMVVRVVDPIIGFDRDMLIAEITYSLSDQGVTTKMLVGPPDGFEPEPDDSHKNRKLKMGGKGDNFEDVGGLVLAACGPEQLCR